MLFLFFARYPRSIQIGRLIKNMPAKPSVIYADEKNLNIMVNNEI